MNELVLDVSMWDEGIDLSAWKKKRNVWGVIIKAGGNEGKRYKDPLFEDHYRSAKSLGLHVGAYYYTTSTTKADAKADADHFAGLLKGKSLDMPAYMDVEDARQYALGRRALTDVIKAFCDQLSKSGFKSGIYVNGSTLTNLVYPDELSKYAVWVAAWKQGWPSYALDAGLWQQGTMRLSDGYVFFDDVSGCVDASWCSIDYPSQITGKAKEATTAKLLKREVAAQVMEHYCNHNAHGYSQYNREGDGTIETITLSDGSTVRGHGGDVDCSELVRQCYESAGVLGGYWDDYMWTKNEDEVLTKHGFERVGLSSVVRGDVLWRSGHTGMYLGNGKTGEAHHGDYPGGLSGRKGDQDGTEVRVTTYRTSDWTRAYHYPESGDATPDESWEVFDVAKTVTIRSDSLAVRDAPSTTAGKVVATYKKGDKVTIDGVTLNGGYAWGSYVGASSGKRRYIALGTMELAR